MESIPLYIWSNEQFVTVRFSERSAITPAPFAELDKSRISALSQPYRITVARVSELSIERSSTPSKYQTGFPSARLVVSITLPGSTPGSRTNGFIQKL
ncbi:MAG: hypothetical protein A4E42_02311 [Methanoregulaceae archaeon PtaU1.Bin222]|nr:MAG: hypothetical protein A4E42_02311 [Methanoregulaceae archaeon PtaU1.Bin222]